MRALGLGLALCALGTAAQADPDGGAAPDAGRDAGLDAAVRGPGLTADGGARDAGSAEAGPPAEAGVSAEAEAGGDEPGDEPPRPGAFDPTRVADYSFDVRLDPVAHTAVARGVITWRNTSRVPADDLWFHLYMNGFENADTLFMQSARGTHWYPTHTHWGAITVRSLRLHEGGDELVTRLGYEPSLPGDRTQMRLPLPTPVAPGESVSLDVSFEVRLPELISRTGYHDRFHMVAQWFPKVAVREEDGRWARFGFHAYSEFYADFGRYDVRVTVPEGYLVGGTGGEVEPAQSTREGRRFHFVQDRVHDFAFTAWDQFRELRGDAGDVRLRVLYAPGDHAQAERVVSVLRDGLPRFAQRFGAYPYATLTVLLPPPGAQEAGGMEYPTFITTDGAWWRPRRDRYLEYVTLHEFGHQYFYGLFASNEHDHPFLDEGFCEYATARVLEDLYGPGRSLFDLPLLGPPIDAWAGESFESASIAHPVPVTTAADAFPSYGRYGRVVYSRTATVLRTAELSYGPNRFGYALRVYADRARFRHPTPETFFTAMSDTLGEESVTRFFGPALRTPFRVDLAVTEAESRRLANGRFEGRAVLEASGGPTLPVEVRVRREDGHEDRVVWDPAVEPVKVLTYAGGAALASVSVDPEGRFALDANRLNNARRAVGRGDGASGDTSPLFARFAWWMGNLLRGVGP